MSLPLLHARLQAALDAIHAFAVPLPHPPVIPHDRDTTEALPGLRFLREDVKREYDTLGSFIRDHPNASALSTNAPYLVAVWDELIHAHQPVAIYRTFSQGKTRGKGAAPNRPVKVDVVAEHGARWVRVNTIKNTCLLMEFREIDSYLTSDDDDDELRPRLAQTELDNSVLTMGRELLAAAKANPASVPAPLSGLVHDSDTITPQVTIRFTRLDPSLEDDPRIEQTIQCLCDMGIDVQLGERPYPYPAPIPKTPTELKPLEPTTDINLDLSALIALISDISHSPLPRTEEEAQVRFEPPQSYLNWKRDRIKSLIHQNRPQDTGDGENDEGSWESSRQHSRALAAQAMQEMSKGLLKEIHERISTLVTHSSAGVTFWTTGEARHRCLHIVSKIGGERERERANALLGSTLCARVLPAPAPAHIRANGGLDTGGVLEATPGMDDTEGKVLVDAYWEHSRYPVGYVPLAPVQVYSSILPPDEARPLQTTFFDALARTCAGILSHEAIPVSPASAPPDPSPTTDVLEEIPPALQTSLPKLTVHTVTSMLAGASRGYTTLTTNKSSVKAVLKEMRRVCGRSGYEAEMGEMEKAALWVVDPRSLSEGMRSA